MSAALEWTKHGEQRQTGPHTVEDAAREYLAKLAAKGRKAIGETRRVVERDVLPQWGTVQHPTKARIEKWIAG